VTFFTNFSKKTTQKVKKGVAASKKHVFAPKKRWKKTFFWCFFAVFWRFFERKKGCFLTFFWLVFRAKHAAGIQKDKVVFLYLFLGEKSEQKNIKKHQKYRFFGKKVVLIVFSGKNDQKRGVLNGKSKESGWKVGKKGVFEWESKGKLPEKVVLTQENGYGKGKKEGVPRVPLYSKSPQVAAFRTQIYYRTIALFYHFFTVF